MWFPRPTRRTLLAFALVVVAGSCADDGREVGDLFDDDPSTGGPTTLVPPIPTDPPRPPGPALGTLELPCGVEAEPTAVPDDEIGIEPGTIVIGTGNDRGGLHTFGSGRGIPDAVEVMAGHCNSLGGLAGREIVVLEYDAAVVELEDRTLEQCGETNAVVGHGYLRETDAAEIRSVCILPAFPAWIDGLTSGEPFPLHGHLAAVWGDAAASAIALIGPDTTSAEARRSLRTDALAASSVEFDVVVELIYPIVEAPDWEQIAASAEEAGAGLVHVDGSCDAALVPLLRALQGGDWSPAILSGPSAYDAGCIAAAELEGLPLDRLTIELPFLPLDDGDDAPVTTVVAGLLEDVAAPVTGDALLAVSAFWRWAVAVDECGEDLSRLCLAEAATGFEDWTSGGLHRVVSADGTTDGCTVIVGVEAGELRRVFPETPGTYDCNPDWTVALRGTDG